MLQNTEIGLGLYSNRAYNIIRALINNIKCSRLQSNMYFTVNSMRIELRPNNETALVLKAVNSAYGYGRWRNIDTHQQAKRALASILKYSATYKVGGGYTKASDRTRYSFDFGSVSADEVKTVVDLLIGRRPRNPEYTKALVGEPLDEVEAGLEAARRGEIVKAKEDAAGRLHQIKTEVQTEYGAINSEFMEKYHELLDLKKRKETVVSRRLDSETEAVNKELEEAISNINKKYGHA